MGGASRNIQAQLRELGYEDARIEAHGPHYPEVVVFEYAVTRGRFRGQRFRLGISMGNVSEGFPEYPPHFLHTCPRIECPRDGAVHSQYELTIPDGTPQEWSAYSRPPGPFWDGLPTKTMRAYLDHVHRFWAHV